MGALADEARQSLAEFVGSAADVVRMSRELRGRLANMLIVDRLQEAGLNIPDGSPLTPRVISDALNQKIRDDFGIDVGDMLDPESVKAATKKEALRVVSERLGVVGGARDIAAELKRRVREELISAARSGDAEVLGAIGLGARAIADAERASKPNNESQQIKNTSEAGQKNRDRQARYRATNKRVWVEK